MSVTKDEWAKVVQISEESNLEVRDSEDHRRTLERVIQEHGMERAELLIVDDIAEWQANRGTPISSNPIAMAVKDGQTGAWGILLRRHIDSGRVESVLGMMEVRGFLKARLLLDISESFLEHTVLHELA
ncbi:MAG: hypothetical protein HYV00_05240, partial [Deltaproteobacteria bacterium]|nr:hypothetical protein [Deltaproteobacteria bacterium]